MKIHNFFFALLAIFLFLCPKPQAQKISLDGQWQFKLDPADVGVAEQWYVKHFSETIILPGTTDGASKGTPNDLQPAITKPQILHLTRKHSYIGAAWYKKEVDIPKDWKGKEIILKLERVIWGTTIWVDDKEVKETGESLIAPHYFNLTSWLTPGKHTISIRIDNRKKYDISVNDMGHAYTNETQIMWNGILGEISLTAKDKLIIEDIQVYPDIATNQVRVKGKITNKGKASKGKLQAYITGNRTNKKPVYTEDMSIPAGDSFIDFRCPMGDDVELWSELNPVLYDLTLNLKTSSYDISGDVRFGMREVNKDQSSLLVNNQKVFLRGTLECCIFPLTGHPPMNKEGWLKVFDAAREWGLNHLRFHSWCPPRAAFEVADSLGFYLQVELPLWSLTVGQDPAMNAWLYAEADCIITEYGNHPSFCFFSMGNELQPDFVFLRDLMVSIREKDPRHLYTTTSFTFEKGHGRWPEPDDDFFITQWTKNGWVRGQGIFEVEPPCFNKDYVDAVKGMEVPLITHEIGQYAVYPDLKEIDKYTGVLDPLNFKGVKKELEEKGLIDKADDYLNASGKLAALLYKEEIERALKTDGCSGFQLLDLHDFPGQGTALVGLLDAFWDSKGLIASSEFRQFCSPVVPLIRYPKAAYTNKETFKASVEIANFGINTLKEQTLHWDLKNAQGKVLGEGTINQVNIPIGNSGVVGEIVIPLNQTTQAEELRLTVSIAHTDHLNSWKIWVYPESISLEKGTVVITTTVEETEKALNEGKKVLFNPDYETLTGLEGKFLPVFWSPVHFPKQAGSMGLLCDPNHKVFEYFPTDMHTDWQWWHLLTASKTLVIDSLYKEVEPLVECVDNFANNQRLTTLFEASCGKGQLVMCSMDLQKDMDIIPEKRQLLYSILKYMNSSGFEPKKRLSPDKISSFVDPEKREYKRSSAESIY